MQSHRLALMLHENAVRVSKLSEADDGELERVAARICENFEIIPPDWQRAIAGVFASLEQVPNRLIDTFIESDESVAGPFIAASPAISEAVLLELIRVHGADGHSRAIARRKHLPEAVTQALRALEHAAIDRALELRQTNSAGDVAPRQASDPMVLPAPDAEEEAEVVALSGADTRSLFETALADRTGLSMASARILCDDPTSKNLLFALRFMGLSTEHAEQIFCNLANALRHDQSVLDRFRTAYNEIDRLQAAERVRGWQLEELRSLALHQPSNLATPLKTSNSAS